MPVPGQGDSGRGSQALTVISPSESQKKEQAQPTSAGEQGQVNVQQPYLPNLGATPKQVIF